MVDVIPEGGKMSTIFDKIIRREVPADIVFEDDHTLAFRDIHPAAPVHVLVIPKRALVNVAHSTDDDAELLGRVLCTARKVAELEGIAESGYRLVMNNGPDGMQSVFHLHVHVLGGRRLSGSMG